MKYILSFILLTASIAVYSQAFNANYTYDANGNRLTATVVWLNNTTLKDYVADTVKIPLVATTDTVAVPKKGYTTPNVDSLAGTQIKVYPNPTHGLLVVQLDGYDVSAATNNITVFDMVGHKLLQIAPVTEFNTVNLLSQPIGTYIMTIQLGKSVKTYTIIKK